MTQNNDTSYREKGRAVFLAAIMVLSVVAGSAAFVGSAAATAPDQEYAVGNTDAFDGLSENIRYEGQTYDVSFDATGDGTWEGEDRVYLAEVASRNDNGDVDGFGSVITIQNTSTTANMTAEVDLSGISSGEYVISNRSTASAAGVSSPFSVQEQDFAVSFDDDSVTDTDNESVLSLDSDRVSGDYNVTVSVSGPDDFDADMIEDVFEAENSSLATVKDSDDLPLDELGYDRDGGDGVTELRDDGYVTLNLDSQYFSDLDSDELVLNFTNLADNAGLPDAGEYTFEFIVTDTGATATDTIQISESSESASFTEGAIQETAGDIATFSFELEDTDETWIQIGDEGSDFVEVLYIKADDETQPVEVSVNTRLLGTDPTINQDAVYDMENVDTFESGYHNTQGNAMTAPQGVTLFGDDGTSNNVYEDYIETDLSLADDYRDQLTRPLQPTDYELQIGGTDVDNNEPVFDADTGGEATDQLASAVLELQQPQIGDITIHTAPGENADDESDIADLVEAATVRDEIAIEDRLIVQVEATGIYGGLVAGANGNTAADPNWDRLTDGASSDVLYNFVENTNESITFEITAEETTGNQEPLAVDLENGADSDTFVVLDEENGQFFVIVDTSSDSAFANGDAPDDDVTFTAEIEYDADNDDSRFEFDTTRAAFSAADGAVNYPYLLQGDSLSNDVDFDLAARSIEFDNVNVDSVLEAENVEEATISGTTNIAPGSGGEVRVASADSASSSFRNGQAVTITDDGTISATFDFSGQEVDDEFTTTYRVDGSSVDSADSIIVEAGSLSDEPPEDDSEEEPPEDDAEEEPPEDDSSDDDGSSSDDSAGDDGSSSDDSAADETTDDETPGFGAIVALVAVLGAALLATRRQN